LSIAAATAAINDEQWLVVNRGKIIQSRQRLEQGLSKLGFAVTPSQANFVWCRHPRRAAKELYEKLKAAHVLVRYMNYAGWGDGLRISVGTDEQTEALLSLLKSMVK
jgi:histidinol-phosphate aminotransferase